MPFRILYLLMLLPLTSFANDGNWLVQYEKSIQQQAKKHKLPGVAFVYVEKGKPAQFFTLGKTEKKGQKITKDTIFRLASVSKTFTSALMSRLVTNNELEWETPIPRLAPEFGFGNTGNGNLTLKHLLSQSSGYTPNAFDNLIEANYSRRRILNQLADLEPLCQPGKCYTYQNALFGVLEHYFESKNSSFRQRLKQEILQPLNMNQTSVGQVPLQSSPNWAKPHVALKRGVWKKTRVRSNYYKVSPAAGVNSSIHDISIWLRAMMGEYPQVITQNNINALTYPTTKTKRELRKRAWRTHLEDAHYGLGWRVYKFDGHDLNYHGGWVSGYRAQVSFSPEFEIGFAMLINAETNEIGQFTTMFWSEFFEQEDRKAANRSHIASD
jgi:beta-lactamase class C